jgi:hypothetical protein
LSQVFVTHPGERNRQILDIQSSPKFEKRRQGCASNEELKMMAFSGIIKRDSLEESFRLRRDHVFFCHHR